ncbi:zinc finger BED domain-containing 4-like, partial [Brachionus plicatilis]
GDDEFDINEQINSDSDSDEEDEKYKAISKPIKVRWNSELKCLRRISKIKLSDLNEALELVDERNLRLSQSESSRLNDIIQILEPFEFVTNEIQGENYSTLSLAVPSIFQLLQHLNNFKPINESLKSFITELKEQLSDRFKNIFSAMIPSKSNELHDFAWYIASVLDPQLKLKWLEITELEDVEKSLFTEI